MARALRELNYRYRALAESGGQLVGSAAAIVLAVQGYGVWTLVVSYLLSQLVVVIAYLPLLDHIPRPTLNFGRSSEVVAFGWRMMGANLLEYGVSRSDVAIIGARIGQQTVGIYSMAFQLATLPLDKVGAVFNRVAFPALSAIKHDKKRSAAVFLEMHRYLLAAGLPLLIGMALTANEAIPLLLTEKWDDAIVVFQAICVINIGKLSGMLMPYALSGLGRADLAMRYQMLAALVLPAAFFVGASSGIQGLLIAWATASIPLYVTMLSWILKSLNLSLRQFVRSALPPVVATGAMACAIGVVEMVVSGGQANKLICSVFVGGIVYGLVGYKLFGRDAIRFLRKRRPATVRTAGEQR